MKRIALLIAAVIICMGGCHKEPHEDIVAARPAFQPYVNELHIDPPDYGESLEQKRAEFSRKAQELKRTLRIRRMQQRIDTIEVARPLN
jgi:hypothetical protein